LKSLFIIRHAKSSWKDTSISDIDRPLNSRGLRDAPTMGERLFNANYKADLMISSPAKRAIHTAQIIAQKTEYQPSKIQTQASIYGSNSHQLIDLICKTNDDVDTLFIFGHNPSFTYLAEDLSNESFGNIPTCGIVALQLPFDQWRYCSRGTANLLFYDYPKNL
tara:strand:+ start:152 stop:643 length:492 start_codon:yes stop_codon:yes gene_type:complete